MAMGLFTFGSLLASLRQLVTYSCCIHIAFMLAHWLWCLIYLPCIDLSSFWCSFHACCWSGRCIWLLIHLGVHPDYPRQDSNICHLDLAASGSPVYWIQMDVKSLLSWWNIGCFMFLLFLCGCAWRFELPLCFYLTIGKMGTTAKSW